MRWKLRCVTFDTIFTPDECWMVTFSRKPFTHRSFGQSVQLSNLSLIRSFRQPFSHLFKTVRYKSSTFERSRLKWTVFTCKWRTKKEDGLPKYMVFEWKWTVFELAISMVNNRAKSKVDGLWMKVKDWQSRRSPKVYGLQMKMDGLRARNKHGQYSSQVQSRRALNAS